MSSDWNRLHFQTLVWASCVLPTRSALKIQWMGLPSAFANPAIVSNPKRFVDPMESPTSVLVTWQGPHVSSSNTFGLHTMVPAVSSNWRWLFNINEYDHIGGFVVHTLHKSPFFKYVSIHMYNVTFTNWWQASIWLPTLYDSCVHVLTKWIDPFHGKKMKPYWNLCRQMQGRPLPLQWYL